MPRSRCSGQQQIEDLRLDGDVERRRRLVGDQQPRIAGDRHGDHHALVHAAGELVRKGATAGSPGPECRPAPGVRRTRRRAALRSSRSWMRKCLADLIADREAGIERCRRLLEDHRDVLAGERAPLAADSASRSRPSKHSCRPRRARDSGPGPSPPACATLLPEPDSPTMPSTSPFVDVKMQTRSTARSTPAGGRKVDREIVDLEQRHQRFSLAGDRARRAARRPSG